MQLKAIMNIEGTRREENGFAEVSKNLTRYSSENNFVELK